MPEDLEKETPNNQDRILRFRFHPVVRALMIFLSSIALGYSIYFIVFLIPNIAGVTNFFKIVTVVVLYVSGSTLYKHLTSLNSIRMSNESLEFTFLLRRKITIPWDKLIRMEIYKVVVHYWKITYMDQYGNKKQFKTSLAFPGIMNALLHIYKMKSDIEMNELLQKVLEYKTTITSDSIE
jgi:hypothetical protein